MRLATKYRPVNFDEVSGQASTVKVLRRMAERQDVPSALLFYGAFGSGKTTTARLLAAALNCEGEDKPCGSCRPCKISNHGPSPDVIEVDAASNGTVDKIREIVDIVQYGPVGRWKVVIFDEAHSMSRDAVNHLLKTLEEPPPYVVFVLVTTEKGKLLPTAPSRCLPFAFTRIPASVVAARLRVVADAEGITASDELLAYLAAKANGAMRDALNFLEMAAYLEISTLEGWRKHNAETDLAPKLLAAASSGNHDRIYTALDTALLTVSDYSELVGELVSCVRDVLVLNSGGTVACQGQALAERKQLAQEISSVRGVKAMGVLWELQTKIRPVDRRTGLEMAVTMVAEKLRTAPLQQPAAAQYDPYVSPEKLKEFTL